MERFHSLLQKGLIFAFTLCLMFVSVYVPQQHFKPLETPQAEAATRALEATQWINKGLLALIEGTSAITAAMAKAANFRLFVSNPLAWAIAKAIIAAMTASIVRWINSGFKGSPAFVQDLEYHMLRLGDRVFSEFIYDIGAAPYVCRPFKLNLQIALNVGYKKNYRAGYPYGASACTIRGSWDNLENFIDGAFGNEGWDNWLRVTTQSRTFTPYGSLLAVQGEVAVRVGGQQQNAGAFLDYGQGFMSKAICNTISYGGFDRERCLVSTPGQVITETLNRHLNSGLESLIVADELGEVVGSLLARLANNALTGAAGLLGLSGGTGYTDPAYGNTPYTEQIELDQSSTNFSAITPQATQIVRDAIEIENKYLSEANKYETLLRNSGSASAITAADAISQPGGLRERITANLNSINALITQVNNDPSTIANAFQQLQSLPLHNNQNINDSVETWSALLTGFPDNQITIESDFETLALDYHSKLRAKGQNREADRIRDELVPNIRRNLQDLARIKDYLNNGETETARTLTNNVAGNMHTKEFIEGQIQTWENLLSS